MKVKTDFDRELTVPKIIEDAYEKDNKEIHYKEDAMEDGLNESEAFYSWWVDNGEKLFEPKEKIAFIEKEIARFFIDMLNGIDSGCEIECQNDISDWFEFEDNGYKYSICVYSNLDKIIGYKEIVTKK